MNKPAEQAIDEYLDQLSAQLGALPPEVQRETREELRQHLQLLVARQSDPGQIIESALHQFGDPVVIGRRLALEWEEGEWNLSGLPLMQRISVIRDANTAEIAELSLRPSHFRLKTLEYSQVALLALGWVLFRAAQGAMPGIQLSPSLLLGLSQGAYFLFFVLGMMACFLEWKGATRSPAGVAPDRGSVLTRLISRAGMSILIPCVFFFPHQATIFVPAFLLLPLILWVAGRSQWAPRKRLVFKGAMGYGLAMGLLLGLTMKGMTIFAVATGLGAYKDWIWLLAMPLFYGIGRWIWKRPAKP